MPKSLKSGFFKKGRVIIVADKMQKTSYVLSENPGTNLEFKPDLTPGQMLALGVFEGKYLNDCTDEFPAEWYTRSVKKRSAIADPQLNLFKIKSRLSLGEWRARGWIIKPDPRGWFQWYCRYWLGRRIPAVDMVQIKRHRAFVRHQAQVVKSLKKIPVSRRPKTKAELKSHRPRQRQALLQWAYDPFVHV